ncbi:hypothetical protein KCU92_g381, partial [Aureobasidium melanogenum]
LISAIRRTAILAVSRDIIGGDLLSWFDPVVHMSGSTQRLTMPSHCFFFLLFSFCFLIGVMVMRGLTEEVYFTSALTALMRYQKCRIRIRGYVRSILVRGEPSSQQFVHIYSSSGNQSLSVRDSVQNVWWLFNQADAWHTEQIWQIPRCRGMSMKTFISMRP